MPMRISGASASFAMCAVLLSGCSGVSQGGAALPSSSAYLRTGVLKGPAKLGAAARAAFRAQLQRVGHDPSAVRIWVVNGTFNYLLGLDQSGRKIVDAIDIGAKRCGAPSSVKIDASQNIWINCSNDAVGSEPAASGGSVQEYSSRGSLLRTYKWFATCPPYATVCGALSDDDAPDTRGHVFSDLSYGYSVVNGKFGSLTTGLFWWAAGKPKATPTFIGLGPTCEPICDPLFLDTDRSGNVWFTLQSKGSRFGLGEISDPTTHPVVKVVFESRHTLDGVFTSDHGSTLNIVDRTSLEIDQYRLPVTPTSKPFRTLGPTPSGLSYGGYAYGVPAAGGFNKAGTKVAVGDDDGWVNLGTVRSNAWRAALNLKFLDSIPGASYTPSDR